MFNSISKRLLSFFCLFIIVTGVNIAHADTYQHGNYPKFAQLKLSEKGNSISSTKNIISHAIENSHAIPLLYNQAVKEAKQRLFPVKEFGSAYNIDRLDSPEFINALSNVVHEFACAEYRFRHRLSERPTCDAYVTDNDTLEHMPFVSGQYTNSRIEANVDDIKSRVSFYAYLPSTKEFDLKSIFGSVHELGTFFDRSFDRRSLILSVHLQTFWLDANDLRADKINAQPSVYFIVLPSAVDIAKKKSQKAAADYAVANAKLLIL